jgi:hypothetical protein
VEDVVELIPHTDVKLSGREAKFIKERGVVAILL